MNYPSIDPLHEANHSFWGDRLHKHVPLDRAVRAVLKFNGTLQQQTFRESGLTINEFLEQERLTDRSGERL